jgi:protein HIRA/HIR1
MRWCVQQFLAAGSQDKSVSVWAQGESKPLLVLRRAFKASVVDLAWTPDGASVIAASLDGTVASICFTDTEIGTPLPQGQVRPPS